MASEESCYRFFLCTDGESTGRRSHRMGRAKQFVQEDSEIITSTLVSGARTHILSLQPTGVQQPASTPLHCVNIPKRWTPQSACNWEAVEILGRVLISTSQNPTRDLCRTLAVQMTMSQSLWYCGGPATQSLTVLGAVGHWEAKEQAFLLQRLLASEGVSELFFIKAT